MLELHTEQGCHTARFAEFLRQESAPRWLDQLRRSAMACFQREGFPTSRREEWRFTNVSEIARTDFRLAQDEECEPACRLAERYGFGQDACCELVFINGRLSSRLSRVAEGPRGLIVSGLWAALHEQEPLVRQRLAAHAVAEKDGFVALNTGFLRDGAFVRLPRGLELDKPVHLLFIAVGGAEPAVSHPRVLIIAEDGGVASLVESYVGGAGGTYLTNAVTEIVAGDRVSLDHCRLQEESVTAFHVSNTHVELGASCRFVSHVATVGGRLSRNDLAVVLAGEGSEATLNGLVVIDSSRHADNHTVLRHARPQCSSRELYKYVLDGSASGVFRGKILVEKGAQKTDAKQMSRSLLLSDDARMNSMPALEIYADDVKCTHGSTTGPVDEEMIFYLRSRGVAREEARHLLTYAFAADVTRRIRIERMRQRLEELIAWQHGLPRDLRIVECGREDAAV